MEIFKIIVELIKAIIWPSVVVGLILMFRKPLSLIINQLPAKFSRATKVSVGGLSVEIQAKALEAGNPLLAEKIGTLSAEALEQLLKIDKSALSMGFVSKGQKQDGSEYYSLPGSIKLNAFLELETKGFLEFKEPLADYLRFVESLSMIKDEQTFLRRTDYHPSRPLSDQETKRLVYQSYSITDLGRQAFYTIISVIVEQLQHDEARKPAEAIEPKK